ARLRGRCPGARRRPASAAAGASGPQRHRADDRAPAAAARDRRGRGRRRAGAARPGARRLTVRREPGDGYALDDDPSRIDVDAVHAYIGGESYWGRGRPRDVVERAVAGSHRVVGLYHDGAQVGFARAVSDGATVAYLADVYVLAAHR